MRAADEAEARGDPSAALRIISREPLGEDGQLFWRPWRITGLEQLIVLEPLLPRWVTSRWILDQAGHSVDPSMRRGRAAALVAAVELRGGRTALPGVDEADAMGRVMDGDWVYRQLYLYDHGGLAAFLRGAATPDLLAGADRIREWAEAPMRALRLDARAPAVLHWTDVGTGEPVEVPDLGGAALVERGETVLGRLVPTSDGSMFEGTPLPVPPEVAAAVAADPGDWSGALHRCRPGVERCWATFVRGSHLVTDVPQLVWQLAALEWGGCLDPAALTPGVMAGAGAAMVRAALRGDLEAVDDDAGPDLGPCVAAVLCDPPVLERLAEELRPADVPDLLALADRLFGPAAAVCRELASAARAAA